MKYIKRILGLPFFLMLNVIGMVFMLFKLSRAFILYGGEAVAYVKADDPKTITDIYQQLQTNHQTNKEPEYVPYHTICNTCKNGGICGCTMANSMVRKTY
jgi:flagellar motor component MotA